MNRNPKRHQLTPAQTSAREALKQGLEVGSILAVGGETGRGKSAILADLQSEIGGTILSISDLLEEGARRHPLALEESAFDVIRQALKHHSLVMVDGFKILQRTVCCHGAYPRMQWLDGVCLSLCTYATSGRKLIFSYSGMLPGPIYQRAIKADIARFRAEDYCVLAANYLGARSRTLDLKRFFDLHRS